MHYTLKVGLTQRQIKYVVYYNILILLQHTWKFRFVLTVTSVSVLVITYYLLPTHLNVDFALTI